MTLCFMKIKGPRKARYLCLEELLTSYDLRFRKRIDNKGGNQLLGPSQGGSGDASGAGDPIVLDDQSLFSDTEYSFFSLQNLLL